MSQKSTISISFKLEGGENGFKKMTMDADSFRKVINASVVEAEKLKSSMINFTALATGIDSVEKTLSSVQGVLKDLSSAYAIQTEAETIRQLEQVPDSYGVSK